MITRLLMASGVLALATGLPACTEKPQTAAPAKTDTPAWQGADNAYVAPGWKAGDKAVWELQLRERAQTQNEYNRIK